MVTFAKANNPDIHEDVILLSGQYKQWQRENMLGIEQSDSELHRIEMSLLELLRNGQLPADGDGGRLPRLAAEARFTEDGNLVIHDAGGRSWSTQTADPDARLAVKSYGVLLIVNAANKVIWEGEEVE